MNHEEIENIENYLNTEDDYLNGFCFQMLCEMLTDALFDCPEIGLKLFTAASRDIPEKADSPLLALKMFEDGVTQENLNIKQKAFVYRWVFKYINDSVFDKDTTQVCQLLKNEYNRLLDASIPETPIVSNMRTSLKEMIEKEISLIPAALDKLDNTQRLNIVCKLLPFVLPKIDSIHHQKGEKS